MLTIKEIFDICKKCDCYVDLRYIKGYSDYDEFCYMIKLYHDRQRHYRLLDSLGLGFIFADRENFEKYICDFLKEAKEKEVNDENFSNKIVDSSNVDDLDS